MQMQRVSTNKDAFGKVPTHQPIVAQSYGVDLPHDLLDEQGQLVDWVIHYAFDTLGARHLDLRIVNVYERG